MTARSGNVRPLRCPNCENFPSPDIGNYSVFHCSSCGALPRGKGKSGSGSSDTFSMNSYEDNNGRFGSSPFHGDDLGYRQTWMNDSPNRKDKYLAIDKLGEAEPRVGPSTGFRRSGQRQEWETLERTTEMEAFQRLARYDVLGGQSSCHSDPNYIDAAEILKKIDELKYQLDRSFDAADRVNEQVPFNRRQVPYSDGALVSSADSQQFFDPYKYDNSKRPFLYHPKGDVDHPRFSGQHGNTRSSPENFERYPGNPAVHHRREVHDPIPRFLNVQGKPSYYHESPARLGPHVPNFRDPVSPYKSRVDGFADAHPQRRVITARRHCRPILGASPFVLCKNCFELLQLPKRVGVQSNNQQKIHCGACSTTLSYSFVEKKLVFSVGEEANEDVGGCEDGPDTLKEGSAPSNQHINRESITNFSSFDDFDNSYEIHSAASGISNEVSLPNIRSSPNSSVASGEMDRLKNVGAPRPAGSSLQELFDYSTVYHRGGQLDNGRHVPPSDQEKVIDNNKVKLRPEFPSEVDVPSSEYSHTQDSLDTSREHDLANHRRGGVNHMTESSSDFSRSSHDYEEDDGGIVTVNGHAIPDCLVKKAERKAGRIRPGDYWYDYRAGFWGIMDGPCLGIVPPMIEEFKFNIQEKCSGGNTGVIVNGRELHQKDLDLLSSRGLPTERGKSYVVEISGRVLDEETGEEIHPLGRLAPTVEKMKRGFGMRVPRRSARRGGEDSQEESQV